MRALQCYLNFDGNTREVMTFYQRCLDGTLSIQTFADVKMDVPPEAKNRVIHARLEKGPAVLMASDTLPGMPFTPGNNFWVNIDCESVAELEKLFVALGDGGKVLMPPADQFWGARFGMLHDKFGIGWMFNCTLPKQG